MPQEIDRKRILEWGNKLPIIASGKKITDENNKTITNIFGNITYGHTYIGTDKPTELKCHIDFFNDQTEGFNLAMTVYFHHRHQKSGKFVRIAIIAYFRRVVKEFYDRMDTREILLNNLKKYYNNMGFRKKNGIENAIIAPSESLTIEQFLTKKYKGNQEFLCVLQNLRLF